MSPPVSLLINGERYEVEVVERSRRAVRFTLEGREYLVEFAEQVPGAPSQGTGKRPSAAAAPRVLGIGSGQVVSSLPGVVVDISVNPGDAVEAGAVLLRIEAMKMQNSIFAPVSGTVSALHVSVGTEVGDGQLLVEIQEKAK